MAYSNIIFSHSSSNSDSGDNLLYDYVQWRAEIAALGYCETIKILLLTTYLTADE